MNNTLLDEISNFENIYNAFKECSKGKRRSLGYKNFIFSYGEKLKAIEEELKETATFKWRGYRDFYVYDPKKRLIMAAPFRDRVVHTAIHRVLEPIVDKFLGVRTYACRHGMGNRNASIRLLEQLKVMGTSRYCVKLDVKKYFESINHDILYGNLLKRIPDDSVKYLLYDLIKSHTKYKEIGRGLPIGNLTSQLFSNFYLRDFDYMACELLGINFYEDKKEEDSFYIRYMDDSVIVARDKKKAITIANTLVEFAERSLKLNIPSNKYVVLKNDPIPFLGFVLSENGYRTLARNERKQIKKLKRNIKNNESFSKRATIIQSYEAWRNLI